jgi:hypothetical protein
MAMGAGLSSVTDEAMEESINTTSESPAAAACRSVSSTFASET